MIRFYHLACVRNGIETLLTGYPMSHRKCEVMASKQMEETKPLILFKEVTKQDWRELGKQAGLDYVCTDIHKGRECVVFQDRPDPRVYQFVEIICYDEDLTVENLKLMKQMQISR